MTITKLELLGASKRDILRKPTHGVHRKKQIRKRCIVRYICQFVSWTVVATTGPLDSICPVYPSKSGYHGFEPLPSSVLQLPAPSSSLSTSRVANVRSITNPTRIAEVVAAQGFLRKEKKKDSHLVESPCPYLSTCPRRPGIKRRASELDPTVATVGVVEEMKEGEGWREG